MRLVTEYLRELGRSTIGGWNRFWFDPTDPAALGLMRILAGLVILYTLAVWSVDLEGFLGPEGRVSSEFVRNFHQSPWAWSHFDWIQSTRVLWCVHGLALVMVAMFTVGLFTRLTSVATFLITVSYAHRAAGTLFGLDQINAMLAMYLMIGPSGAMYSLDRWRGHRCAVELAIPTVSATIATRLIQVHMCVIYLFAGLGKLHGASWWDGTALWLALANYEYQTVDMTWLGQYPLVINLLTQVIVAWELSYCVLIWPRLTRPLILAMAIPLHLGIALCMGMVTFGLIMLVGNLAFVSPHLVRRSVDGLAWRGRAGQGAPNHASAGDGTRRRARTKAP